MKCIQNTGALLVLAAFALGIAACPQPEDPAPKKTTVDKVAELQAKVDAAKLLLKDENGNDIVASTSDDRGDILPGTFCVPEAIYNELINAIGVAEDDIDWVQNNPGSTIEAATLPNLISAMAAFEAAIMEGTLGVGKIRVRGTIAGASWGEIVFYSNQADKAGSTLETITLEKTTEWNVWLDEEWAGETVYAQLTVTKTVGGTPATYTSAEVSIAIPATVAAEGCDAGTLTISQYVFDEGENIAPYAAADASSGGSSASSAVDGNKGTSWTGGNAAVTLELDYLFPVTVNQVSLYHRGAYAPVGRIFDFTFEYFNGTDWQPVYTEVNDSPIPGSPDGANGYHFIFKKQQAQKFRLNVTRARGIQSDTGNSVDIFELETRLFSARDPLVELVNEAEALLRDTAVSYLNGADVAIGSKWVVEAAYVALQNVLMPIKSMISKPDTADADIAPAITALGGADGGVTQGAIASFRTAGQDGLQTPAPTADVTGATKANATDTSIGFTLTGTYEGGAVWKVYEAAAGGTALTTVSASFSAPTLTLSASGALPAGDYFVSVTNSGSPESDRLHLQVHSPAAMTALPRVVNAIALKAANIEFTLTAVYAGTVTFAVYTDAACGTLVSGVTAALDAASGALVLSKGAAEVDAGDYWLTATEDGKTRSEPVKLTVASAVHLVRASIDGATPTIVRVEFHEAVSTIETALFMVKVNDMPSVNMNEKANPDRKPWLDFAIKETRAITAATVVGGSGDKVWNLTMTAPARHGEILRLATLAAGGAGVGLPAVSGLIIHNGVQRTPYSFENVPGFYEVDPQGNHTQPLGPVGTEAGELPAAEVFKRALNRLESTGTQAKNGYTYVIVLGEDQVASSSAFYWLTPDFNYTGAEKTTIIIVSDNVSDDPTAERKIPQQANSNMLLTVRYGINLILGKNAVIDLNNASTLEGPVMVESGGKFILDGGSIRNHAVAGYGRAGGVHMTSYEHKGSYVIINSGTITGNASAGTGSAGGISIGVHGTVLMQGGEISSNSSPGGVRPKAGGISVNLNNNNNVSGGGGFSNTHHGTYSFFMTGGVIKDNTNEANGAGAGGVLTMGTFQKTGGVIEAETPTGTGTLKAGAVAVLTGPADNPAAEAATAFVRDAESGVDNTLFIECVKPAAAEAGVLSVPAWAVSNWD